MAVLAGQRSGGDQGTVLGWFLSTWLPVLIMVVAIGFESTHTFSSDNTSSWMRELYQLIAGKVSDTNWPQIHHHMRKTGHFTGYGLLGLAWLRGWLVLWLQPLRTRRWSTWWRLCAMLALFCTMLVASLDELHQNFLADRTGVVSDVVLDTSGAAVLIALCTVIAIVRARGRSR